jgi:hypothetical protein
MIRARLISLIVASGGAYAIGYSTALSILADSPFGKISERHVVLSVITGVCCAAATFVFVDRSLLQASRPAAKSARGPDR